MGKTIGKGVLEPREDRKESRRACLAFVDDLGLLTESIQRQNKNN